MIFVPTAGTAFQTLISRSCTKSWHRADERDMHYGSCMLRWQGSNLPTFSQLDVLCSTIVVKKKARVPFVLSRL